MKKISVLRASSTTIGDASKQDPRGFSSVADQARKALILTHRIDHRITPAKDYTELRISTTNNARKVAIDL